MPLTNYPYPISNINYMQLPQQFYGQNHQQGFAHNLNNLGEMVLLQMNDTAAPTLTHTLTQIHGIGCRNHCPGWWKL
jgi:hypothetical protein